MPARIHCPTGDSEAARLYRADPGAFRAWLDSLTPAERHALLYRWGFWARPKQVMPEGDWFAWLVLAGRGFGKTRLAAEAVRELVQRGYRRLALIAPTAADNRDVQVEGESGLLGIYPSSACPRYEPSKRRITFRNGAIATLYSAEEPSRLRGPQHDAAWLDEPAAYKDPDQVWALLVPGMRLRTRPPRVILTTTPLPISFLRKRLDEASTVYTNGSTWENSANLSDQVIAYMRETYDGTELGRQELEGQLLGENPGALWRQAWLDDHRVTVPPKLRRIVVAVDPSAATQPPAGVSRESCEVGIIVAGLGFDGCVYVLEDGSGKMPPGVWVKHVVALAERWHAEAIVYEGNLAPGLVEEVFKLHAPAWRSRMRKVTATTNKARRAAPVAARTEKGKVRMFGAHAKLESQLTEWIPGVTPRSPDRLDAMVWAAIELLQITGAPNPSTLAQLAAAVPGSSYDAVMSRSP